MGYHKHRLLQGKGSTILLLENSMNRFNLFFALAQHGVVWNETDLKQQASYP